MAQEQLDTTTGKEIDHQVVTDMLRAPDIRSKKYKQFVEDRLVKQTVDFFQPIKKLKMQTGLPKYAKQPRKVSVLKEGGQAFGDLLRKSIDIEEAMQYPITFVLLAIVTPEGTLRAALKHLLRNFIIEQSEAATDEYETHQTKIDISRMVGKFTEVGDSTRRLKSY